VNPPRWAWRLRRLRLAQAELRGLAPETLVYDLILHAAGESLLAGSPRALVQSFWTGLEMLVQQGAAALRLWWPPPATNHRSGASDAAGALNQTRARPYLGERGLPSSKFPGNACLAGCWPTCLPVERRR